MKTISRYIMTLALLITAVGGAWAQTPGVKPLTVPNEWNGNQSENLYINHLPKDFVATTEERARVLSCPHPDPDEADVRVIFGFDESDFMNVVEFRYGEYHDDYGIQYTLGDMLYSSQQGVKWYYTTEPTIDVTTDAASKQDLFTEAKFNMPAFDATAEYELVRDMSIQMTATMGDGTDGVRYRVKKAQQGGGYEPADMNMMQVLALVAVNDGIEHKDLTLDQDYFCRIYKLDEQTLQPEGDGVKLTDFDFAPGLYALKAFAKDDSDYAGETALSNTFKLFQGYEVEVPAKEFITYYKDEPLYVEDEAAELYTIQSVSLDQAVLSDKSDAMPSNTPMLVYNKSNETKVILLIPCAEPDMAITVAPEFQGTLTGTTIAASTENQTNYAFNGKAFVFVKDDLAIGPNKAWLSVNTGVPSARRITLVFDEATGVNGVIGVNGVNDGSWYDLNGRKLDKMPTKKGVYILNGKKVVVK